MLKRYVVLSLVFLLVPFLVAYSLPQQQEDDRVIKGWLIAKAYDAKGNLLWTHVKEDPFTLNFGRYISLYLEPGAATHSTTKLDGSSGSVKTCYGDCSATDMLKGAVYIGVGTGTVSFSVNNYQLTSPTWVQASDPSVSIIGNKANISVSASFSFSSATTIGEVGLRMVTNDADMLIARDVISKSIPAGGNLAVTWIVEVNG